MFQSRNYYNQNLGTAGHRATSSFSYVSQYTPNNYYNHGHSRSMYQSFQPPQHVSYGQHQQLVQSQSTQQNIQFQQDESQAKGGINSVLEYDLNHMSTFLGWCAFGMFKQNRNPSKDFENLIISVLFATRLPKSTIIIALEYMNQRYSSKIFGDLSESEIFLGLIVALVLGNKFNDDNTFTNKSWSGATGLSIETLNKEEKEWLKEVKWQLNVVNFESNIKTLEECWRTWLEKYSIQPTPTANVYQGGNHSYSSIPSSPIYGGNYHSSPVMSSPVKYSHESIWSDNIANNSNIWSYTPSYQYAPNILSHNNDRPFYNYVGNSNNFVGYSNPYYGFSMASC